MIWQVNLLGTGVGEITMRSLVLLIFLGVLCVGCLASSGPSESEEPELTHPDCDRDSDCFSSEICRDGTCRDWDAFQCCECLTGICYRDGAAEILCSEISLDTCIITKERGESLGAKPCQCWNTCKSQCGQESLFESGGGCAEETRRASSSICN